MELTTVECFDAEVYIEDLGSGVDGVSMRRTEARTELRTECIVG